MSEYAFFRLETPDVIHACYSLTEYLSAVIAKRYGRLVGTATFAYFMAEDDARAEMWVKDSICADCCRPNREAVVVNSGVARCCCWKCTKCGSVEPVEIAPGAAAPVLCLPCSFEFNMNGGPRL